VSAMHYTARMLLVTVALVLSILSLLLFIKRENLRVMQISRERVFERRSDITDRILRTENIHQLVRLERCGLSFGIGINGLIDGSDVTQSTFATECCVVKTDCNARTNEELPLKDVFRANVDNLPEIKIWSSRRRVDDALAAIELKKTLVSPSVDRVAFRDDDELEVLLLMGQGYSSVMWQTSQETGSIQFAAVKQNHECHSAVERDSVAAWNTLRKIKENYNHSNVQNYQSPTESRGEDGP